MIGKFIGAILGYLAFRNLFGALIGAFVGHMFDLSTEQSRRHAGANDFLTPLFAFAGALAKSDGRVSEAEIRAVETLMNRLRLNADLRRAAIEQFNRGKAPEFDANTAIESLKAWARGRRDLAFMLLDMLLDLVHAEGTPVANKLSLVRRLCWAIGVSDVELAAVSAMKGYGPAWQGGPGPQRGPGARPPPRSEPAVDPYVVLGVKHDADPRDIKRAYRKLMSQNHPDKLGNVPDELKRGAETRSREINAAYERIKSERGFT